MRVDARVSCAGFRCGDVYRDRYVVPHTPVRPDRISVVLISEAPPMDARDEYDAGDDSLYARTTIQAFNDAGVAVSSIRDIIGMGVYITTAIKCAKITYHIARPTVAACSVLLERELALFPNVRAYLLMGDVAIQAVNSISFRQGHGRAIPAGSTYKIRAGEYYLGGIRLFPSYLQAGPSFYIERSKRRMIAEDIAAAVRYADNAEQAADHRM